jgi:hypothetical protein
MAVVFDAQSFLDFTASNSFTHTPAARPRMAAVLIVQTGSAADNVTSVTYAGSQMKRVAWAATNSAELGAAWIYWLNTSQLEAATVAVNVTGTDAKTAWAVTFRADRFLTPRAWGMVFAHAGSTATFANPTVTMNTRSDFDGLVLNAIASGAADPTDATLAPLSSAISLSGSAAGGRDFGAAAGKATYVLQSGTPISSGYTAGADDVAMVAAAFDEATAFPGQVTAPTSQGGLIDNLGIPAG